MLQSLTIENYALIEKLHISFPKGLSIITGETGAGKSILLGALSLILGQRADTSTLKDSARNCVVEGAFFVEGYYDLEPLFLNFDIDYVSHVIIRRIITPNGKSRAFVNDTPVTLNVLKEIGERLIDIHSQHQNLLLGLTSFQMSVLDAHAGNATLLMQYRSAFGVYKAALTDYMTWKERAQQAKENYDYLLFQLQELDTTRLKEGEQKELEDENKQLSHAEEIKSAMMRVNAILSGDEFSVDVVLREAGNVLHRIDNVLPAAKTLAERIDSCRIELSDVGREATQLSEKTNVDPDRILFVENRLNTIYSLQQKHRVSTVEELIALKDRLEKEVHAIENFDDTLVELQKKSDAAFEEVRVLGKQLSEKRRESIDSMEQHIIQMLRLLGMPHAAFSVTIAESEQYTAVGKDVVNMLFSANKDMPAQEISRVASGGEISRLMLCLKSLMIKNAGLSTIIFDEIDTGVSGEIADKMGSIIYDLSKNMQVINITHLPQVASKGNAHFVVYKEENDAGTTVTCIRPLNDDERVMQIARLLSGKNITQAAIENAKELLKNNHQ